MIQNTTPQSQGGKVRAIQLRALAESKYLSNPNFCKYCNNVIEINPNRKIAETRKKSFCNHSCSASFQNRLKPKRIKTLKTSKIKTAGIPYVEKIGYLTKGFLFSSRKNWQTARTEIRRHAEYIFNTHIKTNECLCGYSKHLQICHIIPVSEFSDASTLNEINSKDNLVGLCPNCHWELDNFLIAIEIAGGGFEPPRACATAL